MSNPETADIEEASRNKTKTVEPRWVTKNLARRSATQVPPQDNTQYSTQKAAIHEAPIGECEEEKQSQIRKFSNANRQVLNEPSRPYGLCNSFPFSLY